MNIQELFAQEPIFHTTFEFLLAPYPAFLPPSFSLPLFSVCKQWHSILKNSHFWEKMINTYYAGCLDSPSNFNQIASNYFTLRYIIHIQTSSYVAELTSIPDLENHFNTCKENIWTSITSHWITPKPAVYDSIEYLIDQARHRLLSQGKDTSGVHNCVLYGPAGCGKSTIVSNLAKLFCGVLVTIEYQHLWHCYDNDRNAFSLLYDCLRATTRDRRALIHFKSCYDGKNRSNGLFNQVVSIIDEPGHRNTSRTRWIICTTSKPNMMDEGIADRMMIQEYIPPPTTPEREFFFKNTFPNSPIDFHAAAEATVNYTYKDLRALCSKVKEFSEITKAKVEEEIAKFKPQYSAQEIHKCEYFDPGVWGARYFSSWHPYDMVPSVWMADGLRKDFSKPQRVRPNSHSVFHFPAVPQALNTGGDDYEDLYN